jgi:hypothetical protein
MEQDSHLLTGESNPEDEESSKSKRRRSGIIAPLVTEPKIAERLATEKQAPEHIGHMAITTEAKPTGRATRTTVERPDQPSRAASTTEKRVETLSRAELLELSEKVIIDGSSLRQIYETHLIGERGLRRLLDEHLHGGDLKKALRREIIEREIDFERDPGLRDMAPVQIPSANNPSQGKAALEKLLERADIVNDDQGEEAAFFKARATYEASQLQQHKQQRRLADISVAVIIIALLALVITLYMMR